MEKRAHELEDNHKPEIVRSKNGTVRKGSKSVGTSNASKMGHLAVGLAT